MRTIIVTTDFSKSAVNALDYACAMAKAYDFKILLTHVYTIPTGYTGDTLSMTNLKDEMEERAQELDAETRRAKAAYPDAVIETNMSVGGFLETLKGLEKEINPALIVMGAAGEYSEYSFWDEDWLGTLISVACPVLVVPPDIRYKPLKSIAFASDYKKAPLPQHVSVVRNLVKLSGAQLHVVHVATQPSLLLDNRNVGDLQKELADINPEYHTLENRHIIKTISAFTEQNQIDMLIVVPHKHDFWYNLFNKSYTRQLVRLNHLPVIALHE